MDKRSVFFRIFAYFKPYRLYFAVVTLFILVNAGISLIAPYLSGIVFFNQALGGDKDALELLGFKTDSFAFFLLVTVALILLTNILQLLFSVIQSLSIVVVYYVADMVFSIMGHQGAVTPLQAVILPMILTIALSAVISLLGRKA